MIDLIDSNEFHENPTKELKFRLKNISIYLWNFVKTKTFVIILIWLILLKISLKLQIGQIFISFSGILFIFNNLGKRLPGTLSAYSVFNKNYEKLLGTFSSEEVEKQLINRQNFSDENIIKEKKNNMTEEEEFEMMEKIKKDYEKNLSKMGNKLCYCGSEKKYKKCCYLREMRRKEELEKEMKKIK